MGKLKLEAGVDETVFDQPACGLEEFTELFGNLHLGDGLPIVPPTATRLERMMSYCPFGPDEALAEHIGPSGQDITVKDVAVCAIMAGCKPQAMPILVTAFKAMSDKRYNFLQSVTTSHPGGNLILVSGPLAQEVGIHGGEGCLGPGFPANMTVGRAVNPVLINICRSVPGHSDLSCLSSQAELTYCFAEDPTLTPWQTINVVILPWALHSESVVEPIVLPDGKGAQSIEDFRQKQLQRGAHSKGDLKEHFQDNAKTSSYRKRHVQSL